MTDHSALGDTPIGVFAGNSEQADQIMAIVNMWRSTLALAQSPEDGTLDPLLVSYAITASAIMAGTFFGNAVVAGICTDRDRRRAIESAVRNFKSGVDIGKRQGLRVASTIPVAGNA